MKKVFSYWLPDDETHFSKFMFRNDKAGLPAEYQRDVREKAFQHVTKFDVSIDIGANLGLWSQTLEQKFKNNFSIEPIQEFEEYLKLNAPRSTIIQTALGSKPSNTTMTRDNDNFGKNKKIITNNLVKRILFLLWQQN